MDPRSHESLQRNRNNHNEVLALVVLATYEGQWLGAVEVAEQLGSAWRPLAFALRRLAKRGIADETIVQVPGSGRSKEERRLYRRALPTTAHPLFPVVHRTPPGVSRLVRGRYSLFGPDTAAGTGTGTDENDNDDLPVTLTHQGAPHHVQQSTRP